MYVDFLCFLVELNTRKLLKYFVCVRVSVFTESGPSNTQTIQKQTFSGAIQDIKEIVSNREHDCSTDYQDKCSKTWLSERLVIKN